MLQASAVTIPSKEAMCMETMCISKMEEVGVKAGTFSGSRERSMRTVRNSHEATPKPGVFCLGLRPCFAR